MTTYQIIRSIPASPATIWAILTDRTRLAAGDFGITELSGPYDEIEKGQILKLKSAISGNQTFRLRVTKCDAPRQMIWRGGMPFGLFTGTRHFTLTPEENGTLFEMKEEFTGLLAGLIGKSIPDLTPSFETFAVALAAHATKG